MDELPPETGPVTTPPSEARSGPGSSPMPPDAPPGAPAPRARRWVLSGPARYALRRVLTIPVQLVIVLLILYLAIEVPTDLSKFPPDNLIGIDQGFLQLVFNIFTGNWGTADYLKYRFVWPQIFAYYIPASLQLAVFALPMAAILAYPISLVAGWSHRPGIDPPVRLATLVAALLPAFVVGAVVLNVVFLGFVGYFQDIPGQGLIPGDIWFIVRGGYPSWILYDFATQPTGLPLVDAVIHQAWTIAAISFVKTLIQGSAVAVVYVAIFFRHARSIVRSAREEVYIVGARARGVSERTLLWRHAARSVTPSFLLIFALTIPEYLCVQFAVEVAFADQDGLGYLVFSVLTGGVLSPIIPLVFLIAIVVLSWALLVDLIALRLDPRGLASR